MVTTSSISAVTINRSLVDNANAVNSVEPPVRKVIDPDGRGCCTELTNLQSEAARSRKSRASYPGGNNGTKYS